MTGPARGAFWRHPVLLIVRGALAVVLSLAASFALMEALVPKPLRVSWPNGVAALACLAGYWANARWGERRTAAELAPTRAWLEVARGALLGASLGLLAVFPLWATGLYRVVGVGDAWALWRSAPAMALVAVMEEVLMRGVVFRIADAAWGRRWGLGLVTVLFVAAHLPGGQITALGMVVTAFASLALTAAYVRTGRLWAPIGLHFGWNFLFDGVLSVPVSGHDTHGWLEASVSGPAWLSGGAYGIEASLPALVVWLAAAAWLLRTPAAAVEPR